MSAGSHPKKWEPLKSVVNSLVACLLTWILKSSIFSRCDWLMQSGSKKSYLAAFLHQKARYFAIYLE
jgi:hypothetical protein